MNLAALPRISGAGFHALFAGRDIIGVDAYVLDDAELQRLLPDARAAIKRAAKGAPGRSSAFVITDPPGTRPPGIDPAAVLVALTFVKD